MSKSQGMLYMVLRMMMGTIGVCVVNGILLSLGIESGIGVNVMTLGIIGILGFPGFVLLYGMVFYQFL